MGGAVRVVDLYERVLPQNYLKCPLNNWLTSSVILTPWGVFLGTGDAACGTAAVGTVNSSGATYVAAGGFGLYYNFGSNMGNVSISNFDGRTYTGAVNGGQGAYGAGGGTRTGKVSGMFYGPGAAETGGGFSIQATSGPNYSASGFFAGKLTGPVH